VIPTTNTTSQTSNRVLSLLPSPIVILSDSLVCTDKFIACNRGYTSKLINTSCYTLHYDLDLQRCEGCSTYTSRDGFNHYFEVHLARFEVFPICSDPSIIYVPVPPNRRFVFENVIRFLEWTSLMKMHSTITLQFSYCSNPPELALTLQDGIPFGLQFTLDQSNQPSIYGQWTTSSGSPPRMP
jgi:hypothetical protein